MHTPLLLVSALVLSSSSSLLAASTDNNTPDTHTSTRFSVNQQTQVPGATLEPGTYTIHVVDKLTDRTILEVDTPKGKPVATFIGLPGSGLARPASPGAIDYGSGTKAPVALKGFAFPKGPVVEFVYPKDDAVSLAKANGNKVPAIDPASEGKVADPSLSKSDMQVVTLWMLSTTDVGSDTPGGVKAERYQQQVAANHPPRPAIKQLPHTASGLPLIALSGALCLLAGVFLSVRRWTLA